MPPDAGPGWGIRGLLRKNELALGLSGALSAVFTLTVPRA